jgi:hypothetical protein
VDFDLAATQQRQAGTARQQIQWQRRAIAQRGQHPAGAEQRHGKARRARVGIRRQQVWAAVQPPLVPVYVVLVRVLFLCTAVADPIRHRRMHGGTHRMIARATSMAPRFKLHERLPWTMAVPLIAGLSVGLWLVIWEIAQLALAG